jgi:hypothetical protein
MSSITPLFSGPLAGDQHARAGAVVQRVHLELQIDALTAAQVAELGFRPAKGDQIRLPERCGSPSYSIAAIHPTSMGDLNLLLVREDVAE